MKEECNTPSNNNRRYTYNLEYFYKILKIINITGPITTNSLMYLISDTATPVFKRKFMPLLNNGFVTLDTIPSNAKYYIITPKGKDFLAKFDTIIDYVKEVDPDTKITDISMGDLTDKKDQERLFQFIKRRNNF